MGMNHTKGLWQLEADPDYSVNGRQVFNRVTAKAFDGSWKQICRVAGGSPQSRDANAQLIAAAPELLDALKGLKLRFTELFNHYVRPTYSENSHPDDDLRLSLTDTNLAIRKAEGKA
jgi:hypothetical protein